jgi:hypothetical protein
MARTIHLLVCRSRVLASDKSHEPGEREIMALNGHVHVVCHPAIGVNLMLVPFQAICNQSLPTLPIIGIKEYGLTVIASQNDMVQTATDMETRFPGHTLSKHR